MIAIRLKQILLTGAYVDYDVDGLLLFAFTDNRLGKADL